MSKMKVSSTGVDKLDLRFNGKIDRRYLKTWNDIAYDIREDFNALIAQCGRAERGNLDWWLTSVAARDTARSTIFHTCQVISLLKFLAERGELPKVVQTDSAATSSWISHHFPEITIETSSKEAFLFRLRKFKDISGTLLHLFFQVCVFRFHFLKTKSSTIPAEELILVDTFLTGKLQGDERYYANMWQSLPDAEKNRIFFVPYLVEHRFSQYKSTFEHLDSAERNYVNIHAFLGVKDYFKAFLFLFRRKKLRVSPCQFRGVDFRSWVVEEIKACYSFKTSVFSGLYFPFFKELKRRGINVKVAINWFENQAPDKGWNFSLNRFYPSCRSKGYQGFYHLPLYLHLYPTQYELESNVIPKTVCVVGDKLVADVKTYAPGLDVEVSPAFRFGSLNPDTIQRGTDTGKQQVLVALPHDFALAVEILNQVAGIKSEPEFSDIYWVIKPHPLTDKSSLAPFRDGVFADAFWSSNDFIADLLASELVISGRSDTCMTSILYKKPLIVVASTYGIDFVPIPESVPRDLWYLSESENSLKSGLLSFLGDKKNTLPESQQELAAGYFTENTPEALEYFIN